MVSYSNNRELLIKSTICLAGQLYWTDRQNNCIETSDINGVNRKVIATDSDAHIMSIVIHGQFLYYTAWNRQYA